jgi:hypothetical protein
MTDLLVWFRLRHKRRKIPTAALVGRCRRLHDLAYADDGLSWTISVNRTILKTFQVGRFLWRHKEENSKDGLRSTVSWDGAMTGRIRTTEWVGNADDCLRLGIRMTALDRWQTGYWHGWETLPPHVLLINTTASSRRSNGMVSKTSFTCAQKQNRLLRLIDWRTFLLFLL